MAHLSYFWTVSLRSYTSNQLFLQFHKRSLDNIHKYCPTKYTNYRETDEKNKHGVQSKIKISFSTAIEKHNEN